MGVSNENSRANEVGKKNRYQSLIDLLLENKRQQGIPILLDRKNWFVLMD
jgi:hypothetical protein